jgi:hypothetical protein
MPVLAQQPLVMADVVGLTPLEDLRELAGIQIWGSDLGELGEFTFSSRVAA